LKAAERNELSVISSQLSGKSGAPLKPVLLEWGFSLGATKSVGEHTKGWLSQALSDNKTAN
jgi:hypothetical protein